jgi:DNA-binding MarR family transcriptional regulator
VSSITGKIKRLVDDGYVTREQFPEDRRTTYIAITPAGTKLYDDAHARMTKMGSGLDQLAIEDLRTLSELLQQVVYSAHDALERLG